jgi:nicotinate-nucleotide adenylyltransferase
MNMNTGLYFGSFNPIHIGHLAVANYMVEFTPLDRIWFVVSPQNPLKSKKNLLSGYDRLKMVDMALETDKFRFSSSDVEFRLPIPSYTIDTLARLREKHPAEHFSLIMGEDNLYTLHKWKNSELLAESCEMYVYPRPGSVRPADDNLDRLLKKATVKHVKAPLIEISGTFIRNAIAGGKDIRHFLPPGVYDYIEKMGFYR